MRARDVRAIAFCVVSTLVLAVVAHAALGNDIATLALVAAYTVWLLTRPRIQRIFRRLRGDPDWSGYFHEEDSAEARRKGRR